MIPILVVGYFMLDPGTKKQETIQTRSASLVSFSPEAVYGDMGGEASSISKYLNDLGWYAGVQRQMEADWYAGVQAELDRQAAARKPVAVSRPAISSGDVGDCTGFSIPDYIIQRESGGNPLAVNKSSGAFGCAQVMPMHWNGGACSDLDRYTIEGQRECVDRLSRGGTNLNPWAETR